MTIKRKKIALITGITGQDGAYLAKFLLKKNYIVHGVKRRSSLINTQRIDDIYQDKFNSKKAKFILHYGDVTDPTNISNLIINILPDEIYNLAAQSHVKVSFDTPYYTTNTNALGTLNILEAIKSLTKIKKIKFYQASTSEMYGNSNKITINENTPFQPVSPYGSSKLYSYWLTINYRNAYGIHATNGILFNHESPLRGETFISRKITMHVAKKFHGSKEILKVGNLYSYRDWGYAKDYVEGIWKIINYKKPEDFILATNTAYTVKDFLNLAFKQIGIKLKWIGKGINEYAIDIKNKNICVRVDKNFYRPNELEYLRGSYTKAKKLLNWKPKVTFKNLVKLMVNSDIEKIK